MEDFIWSQNGNREIRGNARVGNRLSINNLHGLTSRILPIWAHRFSQAIKDDTIISTEIRTPITNPFTLTIAPAYLREDSGPYTSSLVGFIHHTGGLDFGHYVAYVRNQAGKWTRYDDETVTELNENPLKEAQEAYLYFYQAD